MNICIDQGNSSVKIGVFDKDALIFVQKYPDLKINLLEELLSKYKIEHCIFSTVKDIPMHILEWLKGEFCSLVLFDADSKLPFANLYKTPQTLGKDRLAAVAGAWSLMPKTDLLVIDAGTAVTYDFINANGEYLGGNISPGLEIRAKALNFYTAKLPLVEIELGQTLGMGNDTVSALQSGVWMGLVFEIQGYIESLKVKFPKLSVFLTGGSAIYFESQLKKPIFVNSNLVLSGLNRILELNVNK